MDQTAITTPSSTTSSNEPTTPLVGTSQVSAEFLSETLDTIASNLCRVRRPTSTYLQDSSASMRTPTIRLEEEEDEPSTSPQGASENEGECSCMQM